MKSHKPAFSLIAFLLVAGYTAFQLLDSGYEARHPLPAETGSESATFLTFETADKDTTHIAPIVKVNSEIEFLFKTANTHLFVLPSHEIIDALRDKSPPFLSRLFVI